MKDWGQIGFSEGFNSRLDYIMWYYWATMAVCWMVLVLCSYFLWVAVGSLNHWPMPECIRLSICMHMKNNEKLESSYVLFFIFLGLLLAAYAYNTLYRIEAPVVGPYEMGVMVIGHQWYWSYEYMIPSSRMNSVQKFDFESHAAKSVGWDSVDVGELNYASRATFQDCEKGHSKNPEMYGFEDSFLKMCVMSEFVGSGFVMKKDLIELSLFYWMSSMGASVESSGGRFSLGAYSFYKGSVDNVLSLPFDSRINLSCTSEDVIHGFSVPGLGLKLDCIPGRINATMVFEKKSGVFFGQCHALCGTHHSSMPIRVDFMWGCDVWNWIMTESEILTNNLSYADEAAWMFTEEPMLLEKDLLKMKEKAKKAAEMMERLKVAADGLDAMDPVECCMEKPESGSPEAIEELVEIDESLGGEMED